MDPFQEVWFSSSDTFACLLFLGIVPNSEPVVSVGDDIVIGFIFRKANRKSLPIPLFLRENCVADQHRQLAVDIRTGEHIELPSVFRLPSGGFHATRFFSC